MTHQQIHGVPEGASLYFVGIGGISMSGLAEIARCNDFKVCGSDFFCSEHVEHLQAIGIPVYVGHDPAHIDEIMPDYVIHTAAIPKDNCELQRAVELGIPTIDRGVFLGWLTESFASVINISGTHGKTTTTALSSLLLIASQTEPTVHLGAQFKAFNHSTVRLGRPGHLLVSEACEFNNSFLHFKSTTAVILNIDEDHLDFFGDLDHIIDSFVIFASKLTPEHYLILPYKDENVRLLLKRLRKRQKEAGLTLPRLVWFGTEEDFNSAEKDDALGESACFIARHVVFEQGYPRFTLNLPSGEKLELKLSIPGLHNVRDALAALAAAYYNGLKPEVAAQVLAEFTGAEGRFTVNGYYKGALVVSDYAHHPNAARATLAAAQNIPHGKTYVILQPLTYARVRIHFDDYIRCLRDFAPELVIFFKIFSDREKDTLGMSAALLSEAYNRLELESVYEEDFGGVLEQLDKKVKEGDIVLFLGPEEVRHLGKRLIEESGEH